MPSFYLFVRRTLLHSLDSFYFSQFFLFDACLTPYSYNTFVYLECRKHTIRALVQTNSTSYDVQMFRIKKWKKCVRGLQYP